MWTYFVFDAVANRSKCTVVADGETTCGKSLAGKNPTNLKHHLHVKHHALFELCQKHDLALKTEKRQVPLKMAALNKYVDA